MLNRTLLVLVASLGLPAYSQAADHNDQVDAALAATAKWPGVIRSDVGVTREATKIPWLLTAEDLDYNTPKMRLLLVGGLDGKAESVAATLAALTWFYTADDAKPFHKEFAVSAVPVPLPDAWAAGDAAAVSPKFPPEGIPYSDPNHPEAHYLWRWIGTHAPDLVVIVEAGEEPAFRVPADGGEALTRLAAALQASTLPESGDLAVQLSRHKPAGVGAVPALRMSDAVENGSLKRLLAAIKQSQFRDPSPARVEIQQRLKRTPVEIAAQLSRHYGHELKSVAYIPALALVGRMRLGDLTGDETHLADVEKIVAPYVSGERPTLDERGVGSNLSGHLVFGELARTTQNMRYVELAKAAADLGFDDQEKPKEAMPYHLEMSDSVFMGTPILTQVGRLTGDAKYHDMALRHMRFMLKLNLRGDGLHRHSPLDETAWGRGNGFPALGLALALGDLPADHPGRPEMLAAFQTHMAALAKHQDPTGMWHQVVDHSGSYRELSCTSMITFAMIRGVRNGWLPEDEYRPLIHKGYRAAAARIAADGTLIDVCTGTGKQQSLRDYFDRPAILGRDDRGGAMALLLTTELAEWENR